jgi:hypothetical protein
VPDVRHAELPPAPLDTLSGVQAYDVELMRRQVLHSVRVGQGDYGPALAKLCYLAARYVSCSATSSPTQFSHIVAGDHRLLVASRASTQHGHDDAE